LEYYITVLKFLPKLYLPNQVSASLELCFLDLSVQMSHLGVLLKYRF
jgi:hypothetical protein